MTIRVKCWCCGKTVRGGDDWAGRTGPCPNCKSELFFPSPPPQTEPSVVSAFEQADQVASPTAVVAPPPTTTDRRSRAEPGETNTTRRKFLLGGATCAVAYFGYPYVRNIRLRQSMRQCDTYGIIQADAYYAHLLRSDVVVFDHLGPSEYGARRIDPIHLLMQFGDQLDFYWVTRVVLARNGNQIFYIDAHDFQPLVESYRSDGRIWAFNHLPESVRRMDGTRAFDQWSGGWLAVLNKQLEDLGRLMDQWLGPQ